MTEYQYSYAFLEKGLAISNAMTFLSYYSQIHGLCGSNGISPAKSIIEKAKRLNLKWYQLPTLVWVNQSDSFLSALCLGGLAASVLCFFSFFPSLMILICVLCHQSIVPVCQPFLALQFHPHLIEEDIIFAVSAPFFNIDPFLLIFLHKILLFRVIFESGVGKWSGGDKSWRDGTALAYHYWTQPLPNALSAYFHRRPLWFHRIETYSSLVAEIAFTPLMWLPFSVAHVASFFSITLLMVMINATGSYGHLGVLTISEAFVLLNDGHFAAFFGIIPSPLRKLHFTLSPFSGLLPQLPGASSLLLLVWLVFALPYFVLSFVPLIDSFRRENPLRWTVPQSSSFWITYNRLAETKGAKQLYSFAEQLLEKLESIVRIFTPFHLFNMYIKFAHMTKFRWEVVVEASADGEKWKEYEFKFKPSVVSKRPRWSFGHFPLLDWQLWFNPLRFQRGEYFPPPWFLNFLAKLLEGTPEVLSLLESAPFEEPPVSVRALIYDYRCSHEHEGSLIPRSEISRQADLVEANVAKTRATSGGSGQGSGSDLQSRGMLSDLIRGNFQTSPNDWWYRRRLIAQYGPTLLVQRETEERDKDRSDSVDSNRSEDASDTSEDGHEHVD